jgi:hypothetical protein
MWSWLCQRVERHPVRASALFGIGVVVTFLICFTPIFHTNDDVVMMNTVSGRSYGRPSEHLIFTNVLIGLLLKLFYRITQRVHWYGVYLYSLHALGLASLFYAFVARKPTARGFLLLLIPIAYFEPHLLISVQFTSCAMIVGLGAIAVFLSHADAAQRPLHLAVGCGALLAVTGLVRYAALGGVLAFALPALALGARRAGVRLTAIFLATSIAVTAGAYGIERVYYHRDPAWAEFFRFNTARGLLHGTSRMQHISADTLKEIGWSTNDVYMFSNWFFFDPKVFSTQALETLIKRDQEQRIDILRQGALVAQAKEAWKLHLPWLSFPLIWLAVCLPLYNRRGALTALALSGAAVLAFAGLLSFGHLPTRVAIPSALCWTVFLSLTLNRDHSGWPSGVRPIAAGCAAMLSLMTLGTPRFRTFGELRDLSRDHEKSHARLRKQYEAMRNKDPYGVFMVLGDSLFLEAQLPFGKPMARVNEFELGWPQRAPVFVRYLASLGVEDPYWSLAHQPHVYLMCNYAAASVYSQYMREHYDEDVPVNADTKLPDSSVAFYQALVHP